MVPVQVLVHSKDKWSIRWAVAQKQLLEFMLNSSNHVIDSRYLMMFSKMLLITLVYLIYCKQNNVQDLHEMHDFTDN